MEKVRQVSWGSAAVGGAAGVLLTVLFALVVADPLARWLAPFGRTVTLGVMILLLALLRLVAGMWTAQVVRRRYEVRRRQEFLPTALAAAGVGWVLYTVFVLVAGAVLGTPNDPLRLVLDLLQWLAEFGLGAYLVSPELPGADAPVRGRHSVARRSQRA